MKIMKEDNKEWVYWTDKVTQEVKKRVENSPILKKTVKERGYIVYDEKTPSGKIHIGSARGWVIHDCIAKSMRQAGMNARFILSSDDMDPFDAIPKNLDQEKYKKYLGKPMIHVPSPVEGYKHYGDYYFRQCTDKFGEIGIEAELESTAKRYINGDFNKTIKIALDNADKIQGIYKKIYGKSVGSEKLPFNPICEKCGSIGTTVAYEWDSEKEIIKYRCVPGLVDWAEGCGFEGEISPYNGNGKLPWKVEWAAKWPTVGVVYESAGKDHFTLGGSRSISVAIACEVFNYLPPYPSTCENIGKGYEFFLVGGKKMSTSKGLGSGFVDMFDILPAYMLRFLMVKSRPETAIDFTPEGNTLPLLFNEFERVEKVYFGLEDADDRTRQNAKRIYELSSISEAPKKKPFRVSFEFASMIAQILPDENIVERAEEILAKIGQIDRKLTDSEKNNLEEILKYANMWAKNFAPENYRIQVIESISEDIINKLSSQQKESIMSLGNFLEKERKDKEIWAEINKLSEHFSIKPQEIFEAAYLVLLGKEKGPRLIPFIQSLDRDFVVEKFTLKNKESEIKIAETDDVINKKELNQQKITIQLENNVSIKEEKMMNENEMTKKLFYEDPYQKEFEAKVIEIQDTKVVLDRTCFYPEGGGQVGDSGEINGIKVINTIKEGAEIVKVNGQEISSGGKVFHVLEFTPNFSSGDTVKSSIDWDRRYRTMKLHSASHIMEYFLFQIFGEMERLGTNVDNKKDRSDYGSQEKLNPEKLVEVEKLCNDFISKSKEIRTYPSTSNENIRVWECDNIKMFCGGTHVKNTSEIGKIRLKRENKGAGKERVETYLVESN